MSGVIRIQGSYPHIQFQDFGGYQSRHPSTLAMLRQVFESDPEAFNGRSYNFCICTVDNPESANVLAEKVPFVLTYSTTPTCRPNIIAIPDFVFHGWPEVGIESYESCTADLCRAGQNPATINKLFWIGNAALDPSRGDLVAMGRDWPHDLHIVPMEWHRAESSPGERLKASSYVSLADHCAYSMLLDIRGAGYSGRLKLLMHAHRPVFIIERRFREFFYDFMTANEDFIPIKEDLSDLINQVARVKANPALAQHLSQGATRFAAKYLSKDFALNYLREVLLEIGKR